MNATNKRHAINAGELRRLYTQDGWTLAQLAVHYGLSQTTLRRRLAEVGLQARPRGPVAKSSPAVDKDGISWTPAVAYAIGVIATDGNLSTDGRHLSVTSKDIDLLQTIRACLGLTNAVTRSISGAGQPYHRLQWGNRGFIAGLHRIGLKPAKSLTLGALAIPDDCFPDFLRGCIDGDGSIAVYTDRYQAGVNPRYVYERLAVSLVSASPAFLEWIRLTGQRLLGVTGALMHHKERAGRAPLWQLKYGKRESLIVLRAMYYSAQVPSLARKRDKAAPFIARANAGKPLHSQV
jgi:hypothetical protein